MLSQKYQSQSNALANYDAVDILEGTGIVEYYGTTGAVSGSTLYKLIRNPLFSALSGSVVADATAYAFDTPALNNPRIVYGTGYASFELQNGAGGNGFYVTIKLQKYDGTTATDLSSEYTTAALAANSQKVYFIPMVISTPQQIKIGEYIRFLLTSHVAGGVVNPKMFHNPKDVSGGDGVDTTQMKVGIPFRLDL